MNRNLVLLCLLPSWVGATTYTWTNGGHTSDLTSSSNWSPAAEPTSGDTCNFGTTFGGDTYEPFVTNGGFNAANVTFVDATAYSFTFTNCVIGLYGSGFVNNSSGNQNFTFTEASAAYFNLSGSAGNNTIYIHGEELSSFNWGSTFSLGSINFSLDGGANTQFSGTMTTEDATIALTNGSDVTWEDNALAGNSVVTVNNSSVYFTGEASAQNAAFTLSNTSSMSFTGSSSASSATIVLESSSACNFTSGAFVDSASFSLSGSSMLLFTSSCAPAALSATSSNTQIALQNATLTLGTNNVSTTILGTIAEIAPNPSSLLKIGSGSLSLGNACSYTGYTTIEEGAFYLIDSGSLSGPLVLGNGLTLDVSGVTSSTSIGDLLISSEKGATATINLGTKTLGIGTTGSTSFSGTIEGTGTLAMEGTGTFSLTANNTYQMNVDIASGTLAFSGSGAQTLAGSLSGTGTLLQDGAGTLTLTADNSGFAGTTNIEGGTLVANNSLGGNVNVTGPGIFVASGTVGGDLSFSQGGAYQIAIDDQNAVTPLQVTGTVSLTGGEVFLSSQGGTISIDDTYTILETGGITGAFSSVSAPTSLVVPAPFYVGNTVYMGLEPAITNGAATQTQYQTAKQIDTIDPTPAQLAFLNSFINVPFAEAPLALEEASGIQHTYDQTMGQLMSRQFMRRLYDPIRPIIVGWECEEDWHLWQEGGVGRSSLKGAFHQEGYEITLGFQSPFQENWTAGFATSYAFNHLHYSVPKKGEQKTLFGGVYFLYSPERWSVFADLAYGFSWNTIHRLLDVGTLDYEPSSHPKMSLLSGYVEADYDIPLEHFLCQPFLGIEVDSSFRHKLTESGGGVADLKIDHKNYAACSTRLGAHLTKWQFSLDLAWMYRLTKSANTVEAAFTTFGSDFLVTGKNLPRNTAQGVLTFSQKILNYWDLYAQASGELWQDFYSYNVLFALNKSF